MSLTVQQLLSDAKRLSNRLRDHDQSADHLISRAQEVLKEVDAMRQYQEDVENLNEVAHNRPRAQLVLGIQQENRHIRTLQQENKELRASLEEHQNALELIMSKYRQHVTKLVNTPHPDIHSINNQKIQILAERTEKVCEMAAVMKEAVRVDEEACNQQQELMARLIAENKGLRELLEISQKNNSSPKVKKVVTNVNKEVQTDNVSNVVEQEVSVTLPMPAQPRPPPRSPKTEAERKAKVEESKLVEQTDSLECGYGELSSGDSDETGSEDESVKYDTIKLADRRNKEAAKTREKANDQSEPTKLCPEKQIGVKSEADNPQLAIEPCKEIKAADNKDKMNKLGNNTSSEGKAPEEDKNESFSSPQTRALTEDQQNLVLVDSLVDQIVEDSLETRTVVTDTEDSKTEPIVSETNKTDMKTVDQKTSVEPQVEPTPDVQEQTATRTESSSSEQTTKKSKVEPSHSRSNSKGKNKGNKNSPKKGSKK